MSKNFFIYSSPYTSELKELYITPYRMSRELRDSIHYMFSHPVHNATWFKVYNSLVVDTDTNEMAKVAYLLLRYYLDHPQQFGHNVENITPHVIVRMWKVFIGMHKQFRGVKFEEYMTTNMKMLKLANGSFIEILISDIKQYNMIYHYDDMVKRREGVGLRERKKSMREGSKHFEYLANLE